MTGNRSLYTPSKASIATYVWILMSTAMIASAEAATDPIEGTSGWFANVNGVGLTIERYAQALHGTAQGTFYHGRPPEDGFDKFRYEVGQQLIDDELLDQEAQRREITVDRAWVDERLEALETRYGESPEWQERHDKIVAQLRTHLEAQNRVAQLDEQIQIIPDPSPAQVDAYYLEHPDQFTSPERLHVSMILLRVVPSASTTTWQAAIDEAERLAEKLRGGADFADSAHLYSQDPSADEGGDLGYVHRGMLGPSTQKVLDALEPGELSEPTQLLEGMALFRLENRLAGELQPLESVRERAAGLWIRDRKSRVRDELVAALRLSAELEIVDPAYMELAAKQIVEPGGGRAEDGK